MTISISMFQVLHAEIVALQSVHVPLGWYGYGVVIVLFEDLLIC